MRYKGYEGSGNYIVVTSIMPIIIFVMMMMTAMMVMIFIMIMTIISCIFKYLLRSSMKQVS